MLFRSGRRSLTFVQQKVQPSARCTKGWRSRLLYNEQVLPMVGNRIPSARNRCRFEIQKMKITTKSQIEKLLPELKPNKAQMPIVTTSAQLLAIPMLAVVVLEDVLFLKPKYHIFISLERNH